MSLLENYATRAWSNCAPSLLKSLDFNKDCNISEGRID